MSEAEVIFSLTLGTGNPAQAPDPLYILLEGERIAIQVDHEHSYYEMTASQALEIACALQRAAALAAPREAPPIAIVKELVKLVESIDELEGGRVTRPELSAARAWLAQADR